MSTELISADAVRNAEFETVRGRPGYDMSAVDQVLDCLYETVANYERGIADGQLTSTDLQSQEITQVKLREGYKIDVVDELLERGVTTLRTYERQPTESFVRSEAAHSHLHAPGAHQTARRMSDLVRNKEFVTVRLLVGYDFREVDELLDRVVATLESYESGSAANRLRSDELASVQISRAKPLREGYKISEVDELLEQVAQILRSYES